MSNKPGFFRQLKDTQNYSTKFLIVLFSPNSGVTPIMVKAAERNDQLSFLACVSCYDVSTGHAKWYYGFTDSHLLDYDDDTKRKHITYIMQSGGKVYSLLEDLESMAEYLKGLNLNEHQ